MSQKTQQKGDAKHSQQDLKKVQKKEAASAELAPEMMMEIAADIAISPIADPEKAFFLTTIAQGTFSLKLYERYQKLLEEYRDNLRKEADQVQQELDQLKQQYEETAEQLAEAAKGACKEIKDACEFVEIRATKEVERRSEHHKGRQIEDIRQQLNTPSSEDQD